VLEGREDPLTLTRYSGEFSELWQKVEEGTIGDTTAHDDIARLDYLEYRERAKEDSEDSKGAGGEMSSDTRRDVDELYIRASPYS